MPELSNRRTFLKTTGCAATLAFAPSVSAQHQDGQAGGEGLPRIVAGPYLQEVAPDGATVMWITDKRCVSWVEYGPTPALGSRMQNSSHGLIDAYETTHRIRITGLAPGQPCHYRVVSQEIVRFNPYQVDFGERAQSEALQFTPPLADAGRVAFVTFNDVHQNRETWARLHQRAAEEPFDFLALNGDQLNHLQNREQVVGLFLEPCAAPLDGARPFVFVRGNHEARGRYARQLLDYIDTPNGDYYFSFTWGPVHCLVIDGGEDKLDDHPEYSGLVHFEPYLRRQAAWVAEQVKTDAFRQAAFRVVLCHIPLLRASGASAGYRAPIIDALDGAGIDLAIAGHTHRPAYHEPEADRDYPVVIGGANEPENATVIRVEADQATMRLRTILTNGTVLEEREFAAKGD